MNDPKDNKIPGEYIEPFTKIEMPQRQLASSEEHYNIKDIVKEAKRCLRCENPLCRTGCPIENYIPEFIGEVAKGNFGKAREYLAMRTNLPAVCGRVCPRENQCEGHCILAKAGKEIQIGLLERFVADFDYEMEIDKQKINPKGRGKVAVIGSGPAGLTVAGDLAKEGFNVTVFERESEPGGVLIFGIPEYRLPKEIVKREIKRISSHGVNFVTNSTVGETVTVGELFEQGFDAVFVGTGTAHPKELNLPGKDIKGIMQSAYFLRMTTLFMDNKIPRDEVPVAEGDKVIVIGGGNVSMDASRTAKKLGASDVTVLVRRSESDITATKSEYEDAVADNIKFAFNTSPIEFVGNNELNVNGIKVMCEDGEKIMAADKVLIAIGSVPAKRIISSTDGIEVDKYGYIITKERPYGMTTLRGVFAGGDVVHRPATVVLAMKEAKKVAVGILQYVDAKKLLE